MSGTEHNAEQIVKLEKTYPICLVCWAADENGKLPLKCIVGQCNENERAYAIQQLQRESRMLRAMIQPDPVCSCRCDGTPCLRHGADGDRLGWERAIRELQEWAEDYKARMREASE